MKILVKKLDPRAHLPEMATAGSACFDLHARIDAPVTIAQDCPAIISTGLSLEIPTGFVALLFSRSGHGFKSDIRLGNSVGVLDSDYRGEVKIKLAADGAPYEVQPNERIAQVMLLPVPHFEFEQVAELSATERGTGGFGSTGT